MPQLMLHFKTSVYITITNREEADLHTCPCTSYTCTHSGNGRYPGESCNPCLMLVYDQAVNLTLSENNLHYSKGPSLGGRQCNYQFDLSLELSRGWGLRPHLGPRQSSSCSRRSTCQNCRRYCTSKCQSTLFPHTHTFKKNKLTYL